jgi:hypothetical protein
MTGFFVAIILAGSFITALALVMLVVEKSHERDHRLDVTERKDRLVDVMDDADLLVEELNRFADYAVSACEDKRQEVERVLFRADQLLSQVAAASASLEAALAGASAMRQTVPVEKRVVLQEEHSGGTVDEPAVQEPVATAHMKAEPEPDNLAGMMGEGRGRVLALDARRAEALRMARKGMTHAEIARTLQLGKGEIELIARMGNAK